MLCPRTNIGDPVRKWIDADRAGLRTRTRLTEAARDWKNAGRDTAYLYTGALLAVAKEWEASRSAELSNDEMEFLRSSLEAQSQREANELEIVQRLARAEAERAEEAEKRKRDSEERNRELESLLEEAARSDRLVAEGKLRQKEDGEALAHLARASRYTPKSYLPVEAAIPVVLSSPIVHSQRTFQGHVKAVLSAVF